MDVQQYLREKLTRIENERDEYAKNVPLQMAAFNGAIQVLQQAIEETAETPVNGKVEADELEKVFGG